tara:strand:+ start:140 stop:1300 length:1161 start_codon:yes stop_codon:yes gene_type:complete
LRNLDLSKIQLLILELKKLSTLENLQNIFSKRKKIKICALIFLLLPIFTQKRIFSDISTNKYQINKNKIKWEKIYLLEKNKKDIIWENLEKNKDNLSPKDEVFKYQDLSKNNYEDISSLNRSIVFNDSIVGPDISWLVPPGFKWNNKYKFDASTRGHSGRFEKGRKGKGFWDWNNGDAVGQFYYQFLNNKKTSFGLNYGIRSLISNNELEGSTPFGEGQSLGFRIDRKISATGGFSFGAEQLIHFDELTDTGRDIYLTLSKALWNKSQIGNFPLDIYTFGIATGRMAEGNIKFLCSDLFGGSGTELLHQRRLCWAPVFSISRVFNKKLSTFFEYNSKWFLLGSSIIPFNEFPLRGTFAVQLSDHTDNYKLNKSDELKWVFRLSLGF